MINKQGLWFLTLFSLILVLSIYYITMPNEMFLTNNSDNTPNEEKTTEVSKEVETSNYITVLKMEYETQRDEQLKSLEQVLNSGESSANDKNNAYEAIKNLNNIKGLEEQIETKIKKELELNSFVKATDNEISIVVEKDKHDVKLANQIMRIVQEEFDNPMTISVKFATSD